MILRKVLFFMRKCFVAIGRISTLSRSIEMSGRGKNLQFLFRIKQFQIPRRTSSYALKYLMLRGFHVRPCRFGPEKNTTILKFVLDTCLESSETKQSLV